MVSLFLFGVLAALLIDAYGDNEIKLDTSSLVHTGSTDTVGTAMFRSYLVPFEVVSLLLSPRSSAPSSSRRRD